MDSSDAKIIETQKRFPWREDFLATALGRPRTALAEMRGQFLLEGTDWARAARVVCLTESAAIKLAERLGLSAADVPALYGEQKPAAPVRVWAFTVHNATLTNKHIVLATDGPNIFRVRVKSNVNFRKGMAISCTHVQADLFELHGNCPRFPGKY